MDHDKPRDDRKEDVILFPKGKPTNRYKCYGKKKTFIIQATYIISALVWIFMIGFLSLYRTDQIGALIVLIPLFTFGISYMNASYLTVEVEEDMFKANFLSIGLLLVLPLLTWMNRDYTGDRKQFYAVLIGALIFTLLSLTDVWVRKRWVSLVKHVKSVFQVFSLTLLIFALYLYYINRSGNILP